MNYKKIAKFIKDARHLTIWNDGSLQYISDGVAEKFIKSEESGNE